MFIFALDKLQTSIYNLSGENLCFFVKSLYYSFIFTLHYPSKLPRAHADYIDDTVFLQFLRQLYSSGAQEVHIMLEAKQKDDALFALMHALTEQKAIQPLCGGSFFFA